MPSTARLNSSRSSALRMAGILAPISSTPKRSRVPSSPRATARFSAVWPPRVGSSACGRLLALVEDVVDASGADPDHLAVAPQLLTEHAHAALDALLDGVRLQRGLALRGERRPLGLLSSTLDLPVRDQVFRHGGISLL